MQLYIPANDQELAQIEAQVQEALSSTMDFSLKKPEKLRELTCRILGFPNGYQQLKTLMVQDIQRDTLLVSEDNEELADFLQWMRTITEDVLSTREMRGIQPCDVEDLLVYMMDELVFDFIGTGKHVSDSINNQGLDVQVAAVISDAHGGCFQYIAERLEDELPEVEGIFGKWEAWRKNTLIIPAGYIVEKDEKTHQWSWYDDLHGTWSHDIYETSRYGGSFISRTTAINDAVLANKHKDHH